ncbi:RNA exonuclease 3 [Ophidiomyces ophidiicola]|uniref:RNA exonuclease 3 n=1 Tax=Ophidiomyces ophidiicola TaxID=1387563 RepID=A0ACB8UWG5_9EURO|nr:RNA exonuclease 3 [Ophidiomyces ophidiicola]KAI1955243.1 RNA exonuclease 3 [Ophidiomyces ophidiicola]KAI1967394.1 RNA exonuclease 3 [Ophidiomyces ophidiicola]KAI1974721.1 RNA exonuclease 3 [Ophidiomyces ophidiicola]KAI2012304.1 RNA exonuclease 3 [Ophidiomyces ophidiicola]
MFNPVGLFKEIPCPEASRCNLLNCMFSHSYKESTCVKGPEVTKGTRSIVDTNSTIVNEEPLRKKRRINAHHNAKSPSTEAGSHEEQPNNNASHNLVQNDHKRSHLAETKASHSLKPVPQENCQNASKRKVGLPAGPEHQKKPTLAPAVTPPHTLQIKRETLNPRHLSKPPAAHSVRVSILSKLHEAMVLLNNQLRALKDQSKMALVLSDDELVSRALDEEEKAAKESSSIYSNIIKLRIVKLRKMTLAEWEEDILLYLRPKVSRPTIVSPKDLPILTGLDTQGEIAILSRFIASLETQAKAGYVIEPPSYEDIKKAASGSLTSQGWEQCDRCNGRFQVFPGRREDGLLASGGQCTYHHARLIRPPKKKTDHIVGQTEAYFPCCNETVGTSPGCTKAESHVFKVTEVKRLAAVLQFEKTPRQPGKSSLPPVCFDCEMGYTTLGLELIRLTAVTWPEGKRVLDILVRPMGEILDLNSRYSGVRPEHYVNALPYRAGQSFVQTNDGLDGLVLPIVESPAAARSLLFSHLQPETPVIGHAIDNDLNACRIIHPTIVDTVLLYPHPGGLPFRHGLRALAKKYLDRHIQTGGGNLGHDSMEDAKATGDLVRVKVRETWVRLKSLGWKIRDGALVKPEQGKPSSKLATVGVAAPEIGAGAKRTAPDDATER